MTMKYNYKLKYLIRQYKKHKFTSNTSKTNLYIAKL